MTVFWDRTFREVIEIKWCQRVGPRSNRIGVLIRKGRDIQDLSLSICTEERPNENVVRRWPSIRGREPSPENKFASTLLDLRLFSLQNSEEINVCSLSYPVCDILLCQPELRVYNVTVTPKWYVLHGMMTVSCQLSTFTYFISVWCSWHPYELAVRFGRKSHIKPWLNCGPSLPRSRILSKVLSSLEPQFPAIINVCQTG